MVNPPNDSPWSLLFLDQTKADQKAAKRIQEALEKLHIPFEAFALESPDMLRRKARSLAKEGKKKFLAAGREEALNATMNGMLEDELKVPADHVLGFIPSGEAKNWHPSVGIPSSPEEAARNLKLGHYFYQDLGLATYIKDGQVNQTYFLNAAALGWLGKASQNLSEKRAKGKKVKTLAEIKRQLHHWKGMEVEISIDGTCVYQGPCFSLSVHLGQAHGQGFVHAPNAIPDDGLFEIQLIPQLTTFERYSKWSAIRQSSFMLEPMIKSWQGEQIEVNTAKALPLALDESYVGEAPARLDCLYQRLRIISMLKNMQP